MACVLSVYAPSESSVGFGFCRLAAENSSIVATMPSADELGLVGRENMGALADSLMERCEQQDVRVLVICGPQGWKDPHTPHGKRRVCEAMLNTPFCTGVPGQAEPESHLRLARFSIPLFAALSERGGRLAEFEPITVPETGLLLLESFPGAAWPSVGLEPLPPVDRVKHDDPHQACVNLRSTFGIGFPGHPSYEQAQAFVTALAGLAALNDDREGYRAAGAPPHPVDGKQREGYIVLPTAKTEADISAPRWQRRGT